MEQDFETDLIDRLRLVRQTPEIVARIASAQVSGLALQSQLRRDFAPEIVTAALSLMELRRKAARKFTRAESMWLERTLLEQCTTEEVARYKAHRFMNSEACWDLCCGLGSDAIAMAQVAQQVIAVDRSPLALELTGWNGEVYGIRDHLELKSADVTTLELHDQIVHIDPDRRAEGAARTLKIADFSPPLDWLQNLTMTARGGAIKLSPASNFGGKFEHAEIELISLFGECKEATVWFGTLQREGPYRATVLPSGASIFGHPLAAIAVQGPLSSFLLDPDPAVVRAGLVDQLAVESHAQRLDQAEEYLTREAPQASPFYRQFQVLEDLPYQERAIRDALLKHDLGAIEIKCRHIPVDVDALRKKVRTKGQHPGVVIIARLQGKSRAIVAKRVD